MPLNRGLFTTASVPLASALRTAELLAVYREFYAGESFVRVLGEGERPTTRLVVGSNYCDVAVVADPRTSRAICVSAIDNLGKGGSANGVQNLNVLFGWHERTGLEAAAGLSLSQTCPTLEWLDGGITAVPGIPRRRRGRPASSRAARRTWRSIHSPTPARVGRRVHLEPGQGRAGAGLDGARAQRRGAGHPGLERLRQRLHRRAGCQDAREMAKPVGRPAPHPARARAGRRRPA